MVASRSINGVSNGEINRELMLLKRMLTLALQSGKLMARPHVPILQERNTRAGFFYCRAVRKRPGASAGRPSAARHIQLADRLADSQ